MIAQPEIFAASTTKVACKGDAESPHPQVYLTLAATGRADCPYCGKRYVLQKDVPLGGH